MLTKDQVQQILHDSQALTTGHFLLTSGRHSGSYMQCAKILQRPDYAMQLVGNLTNAFKDDNIDMVISPAIGGIIIGYELARQMQCPALFTEREGGQMTLRRSFYIPKGARVVVAEDVITTGGSVKEVIEIVKAQGGIVAGVAVLVDRSGGTIDFGTKTIAAYTSTIQSYEADDCPLCKENAIPLVKPGSR